MAHTSVINRERAKALDSSVEKLDELLPSGSEEDAARELLEMARRDVVARNDQSFQGVALVTGLVEIVAAQERRISALEAAQPRKRAKTAAAQQ
jgi:hypothetical protein